MKKMTKVWIGVVVALVVATGGFAAYQQFIVQQDDDKEEETVAQDDTDDTDEVDEDIEDTDEDADENQDIDTKPTGEFTPRFAAYQQEELSFTPAVESYEVESDLSNIDNASQFEDFQYLGDDFIQKLAENAFAVTPGYTREFYQIYEANRYSYIPNFITTDSVMHNYHLMFDFLLKQLEEEQLIAGLENLTTDMLQASEDAYDEYQGSEWENAAARNVGFFAVAASLLDLEVDVPDYVADEVAAELALVAGTEGIADSPLMNMGSNCSIPDCLMEDYSQYIPRGHYTKSDDLKRYFKAMMWYGRLTFRFKFEDEVRSAALITSILAADQDIFDQWEALFEPINFFVGKADDITYYEFSEVIKTVYGTVSPSSSDLQDADNFLKLLDEARKLEPPQINSMPIWDESLNPDREEVIIGYRFMGQRFTVDASIFQRLIEREVATCLWDWISPPPWAPRKHTQFSMIWERLTMLITPNR
jgi:hypothetical protein